MNIVTQNRVRIGNGSAERRSGLISPGYWLMITGMVSNVNCGRSGLIDEENERNNEEGKQRPEGVVLVRMTPGCFVDSPLGTVVFNDLVSRPKKEQSCESIL